MVGGFLCITVSASHLEKFVIGLFVLLFFLAGVSFFLLKAFSKKLVYLVNFKCNTYVDTHTHTLTHMYIYRYMASIAVEYFADVNRIFPFSFSRGEKLFYAFFLHISFKFT